MNSLNSSIVMRNTEERKTQDDLEIGGEPNKNYLDGAKELASNSRDNLNAAAANFMTNVQTTISLIMLLNAGLIDPNDKIPYGFGIMSIFLAYLLSFLLSDQPFFKGLTLTQVYIIQYQINQYGKNSLYFTCILAGIIIIGLTAAKFHRLNKVTPHCILIGLKIGTGRLTFTRIETHRQRNSNHFGDK